MKGKKNTYLLLTLVLVVWGIIGYRIIGAISPSEAPEALPVTDVSFRPEPVKQQARFELHEYPRDPFLGTYAVKPVTKPTTSVTKKPEIPWPAIRYSGLVGGAKSGENIYFIYIDSRQYLLKPGSEAEGIKLVKGSPASVVLRFKGQNQTFLRKE
ncbi:hypothetical protein [Ascidiimonas aurantiaca]|uniref:hypothetical protein n=1 Tax=Ascidiimonas aurantiaca TaxID=1685432 RepID=UPI0030EE254F